MKIYSLTLSLLFVLMISACSTDLRKGTVNDYQAAALEEVQKVFSHEEIQSVTNALGRFEAENISLEEYGPRLVVEVIKEQQDWEKQEQERLAEQERQRLAHLAVGTKKMQGAISFKVIKKDYQKSTVGDYIVLHIALNNKTSRKLRSFYGLIEISDQEGNLLHKFRYTSTESVPPNSNFEERALMACKPNDPNIIKIRESSLGELNIKTTAVEVGYTDNSKISIKEYIQ